MVATVRDETSLSSKLVTLVAVVVPPLGVAAVAWRLWGVAVHPVDVVLFAVMYVACGLGITVGYHRLFAHRSFRPNRAVKIVLAAFGSMAVEGSVIG